ncbi:MAG: amylo-alpha-1,6-glucosidase [Candidatus Levybacteria bacterium]|nr:amylo-alpha-1,6-glucosidase [Candidatus Levybacteria bacterium]
MIGLLLLFLPMDYANLRENIYKSLLSLFTEDGIYASSKEEVYGCIFGRDSAITILKILKVCSNKILYPTLEYNLLQDACRRSLLSLVFLQGKEKNIESGEEPGKYIHEYRKDGYERLIKREMPWYIYPDGILRNYDSIDSTPLTLIAIYRFWELTRDKAFLDRVLPSVERALQWIIAYADIDHDNLVEYEFHKDRKHGGLKVQSWTDSHQSLQFPDGKMPEYPIAPVEVQGYVWLALKLWSDYYNSLPESSVKRDYAAKLELQAKVLKQKFNSAFIFKDKDYFFTAQALDGKKNQIKTVTGNSLLLLWSSFVKNGKIESILEEKYVNDLVKRSFESDMYDADAGIRTMSSISLTYNCNQDSYHNGSFWPKLNGMIHEGLEKWSYVEEAEKLKFASLKPIFYFGTPIELYLKKDNVSYMEYRSPSGQVSCRQQAWSAAAALDLLTV